MLHRVYTRARYWAGTKRQRLSLAWTLRRTRRGAATLDEAVTAAFTILDGSQTISPIQVRSEITEFVALVHARKPRRVLEIGTHRGGTLYLLAWASEADARILSVDVQTYEPRRRRLYRSFARSRQVVHVLEADSHLASTRETVTQFFEAELLDVLFIDGDHSYEGVKRDYELYAPLVRPDGIVAFHDIVEGPPENVGGVPEFWREIRDSLDGVDELVESWTQGGYGIGLGRVPPQGVTQMTG
jgi:predicted O-methyltransferase YrrM